MSEESRFIIEVAQFMGGIDKVLTNIQNVLETIPKATESEHLKKDLNELRILITEFKNIFSTYTAEATVCSKEVKTLLSSLNKQLQDLKDFTQKYNPTAQARHIEDLKKIHDQLCGDTANSLNMNIREAGKFAHEMQNEINRLEVLFADKVKADDLKEIIEFTKIGNETRKKWSGKKKVFLTSIALLFAALLFIDKIIYVGKFLDNLTNPPAPIIITTESGEKFKIEDGKIVIPAENDLKEIEND